MKKLFSIILSAAMVIISLNVPQYSDNTVNAETESKVSVWDGTYDTSWYDEEETEFYLKTAQEFAGLFNLINYSNNAFEGRTIFLEKDFDMSKKMLPQIGSFKGIINGKYHSISNYQIQTYRDSSMYGGMFSTLEGTVCNLKLNINENQRTNTGIGGGICGVLNGGTISNCSVTGFIDNSPLTLNSDKEFLGVTGGICGKSVSGTITGCSSSVTIQSLVFGSTVALSYVGGICGISENETVISNSYFNGKIDNYTYYRNIDLIYLAHSYSGGIIGKVIDKLTITNVYSTGTISGKDNAMKGGVIGARDESELIGNKIYYLASTASFGVRIGEEVAIAKSDANMKKESFAESLGSAFIYKENSYPPLGWEYGYTEPITTTTTTTTTSTTTTSTTTTTTTSTTTASATTTTTTSTTTTSTATTPLISTTTTSTTTTLSSTIQQQTTTTTINSEFKLEVTSIAINNGDQYTIPINRDDLVYKSTNTDVAVVSPKGVVTAIGTGEAVINIIDKDYNVIQLKVSVKSGGSSQNKYPLGDVNNDGKVNAVDASTVLTYYANISTNKDGGFTDAQKKAADLDNNGDINAVDASYILSYYAYTSTTKEEIMPVEEYMKKK